VGHALIHFGECVVLAAVTYRAALVGAPHVHAVEDGRIGPRGSVTLLGAVGRATPVAARAGPTGPGHAARARRPAAPTGTTRGARPARSTRPCRAPRVIGSPRDHA